MDYLLGIKMVSGLFSFKKKIPGMFSFKRISSVLVLVPVFCTLLILNRFFMLFDYIFFPGFIKQQIKDPVFILSTPRSATTYLFHSLAKSNQFSSFKLWEILFAPSVCQKFMVLLIARIDNILGKPFVKMVKAIDHKISGKFKRIHFMGLDLPEEDELLLMWNLSTAYFSFFIPDVRLFDDYVYFDEKTGDSKKKRIMRFYKNCVKRHEFVFNRNGQKYFLSKNSFFIPKYQSLKMVFPTARIISLERNPVTFISSTLSMNQYIYAVFSKIQLSDEMIDKIIMVLVSWFKKSQVHCKALYKDSYYRVYFDHIINQSYHQQIDQSLANFLHIENKNWLNQFTARIKNTNHYKSNHHHYKLTEEQEKVIKHELNSFTQT